LAAGDLVTRSDFDVIEVALRRYKLLARLFRWGGLSGDVESAGEAIEALERIRRPRLGLFEEESGG
jgi:hypothetical protein